MAARGAASGRSDQPLDEAGADDAPTPRSVGVNGLLGRPVRNLPMTARENCGYFLPKTGLPVRFKILSIWSLLRDESAVY